MEKIQVLLNYLDEKGIQYEVFEDYVRVYFTDVFEVLGIDWRKKEWDELAEALSGLAREIEKATGWRTTDLDWDEDTDGWIFWLPIEEGEQ